MERMLKLTFDKKASQEVKREREIERKRRGDKKGRYFSEKADVKK